MKAKKHNFFRILSSFYSQNQTTIRRGFSEFLYTLFSYRDNESCKGRLGHGFFNQINHAMKKNNKDCRSNLSISKLPKLFLLGVFVAIGSMSFAQTSSHARMDLSHNVTIRTGLHASYEIHMEHFGFATKQDAEAYFLSLDVAYIDFVVVDEGKVLMNFDLTNPAVTNWTLADWQQALATRASNSTPRPLPNF
ncbi:MAG: hypothetical protein AB8B56_04730 [Crocinitomicaceae bacterium]